MIIKVIKVIAAIWVCSAVRIITPPQVLLRADRYQELRGTVNNAVNSIGDRIKGEGMGGCGTSIVP